ncbi:hypothetical protein D9M69_422330 [compost metagenome]
MQLDSIKTCVHGQACRLTVVLDDCGNLHHAQRMRGNEILKTCGRPGLSCRFDRGRCLGQGAFRKQRGVGDASAVHQLHEDSTTTGMHGLGHLLPGCHLIFSLDAGRTYVALAKCRGVYAFTDDQPRTGTLRVVGGDQVARYACVIGTGASHWGHDHSAGQVKTTDTNWRK